MSRAKEIRRDQFAEGFAQWFWNSAKLDEHGCWKWLRGCDGKGYGGLSYAGRYYIASRVAYALEHGEVPEGAHVLHSCDRGHLGCVNPHHLYLGTHKKNMQDANERSRIKRNAGAANHMAKLTAEQAADARQAFANGGVTITQLCKRYELSWPSMKRVVFGRSYQHATPTESPT